MDGIRLEHSSQYEGRIKDYVRGIIRRTSQSSGHTGLFGDKRSPSRCCSFVDFSSNEDLRHEYFINGCTKRPQQIALYTWEMRKIAHTCSSDAPSPGRYETYNPYQ